ncbi:hypothetical protein A3767_03175 [Oleiphilus sp. HI0133]|nr:hypothetical protein A3767_22645 [Oleiphilus sp. HI0133]KZZ75701.1 hypothetical protein A3767_03175 [Oleiphilus sp. HI0133]
MSGYLIPSANLETELIVKKSRFITFVFHTKNRAEAMIHLQTLRERYTDARHHCWAYLLGDPKAPTSVAMSDDGEPSGTAGKPMLNVMQHKDVGDIFIVVVRYFGGIKLGAGGLVRAYSSAVQAAYDEMQCQQVISLEPLRLSCAFDEEQKIRYLVDRYHGVVDDCSYSELVSMAISLPSQQSLSFKAELSHLRGTRISTSAPDESIKQT